MHNFPLLLALLALSPLIQEASAPSRQRVAPAPVDALSNPKFDLASTNIEWHRGIESVLNQDKPILLFQLLGNFDDAFC